LWNIKINAATREKGITYSQFINKLKKGGIELDRKILAHLAEKKPEVFEKIIEKNKINQISATKRSKAAEPSKRPFFNPNSIFNKYLYIPFNCSNPKFFNCSELFLTTKG